MKFDNFGGYVQNYLIICRKFENNWLTFANVIEKDLGAVL